MLRVLAAGFSCNKYPWPLPLFLPEGSVVPYPIGVHRRGLTHAEVLILVAILVLICSLVPIGVQKVRESAAQATCINNLKMLGLAIHNHTDVHKRVPAAWNPDSIFSDRAKEQGLSAGSDVTGTIHFQLLPFIEQERLWNNSKSDSGQFDFRTGATAATVLPVFLCPADPSNGNKMTSYGYASCNYLANLWVFDPRSKANIIQSMPDGSSNTIMFTEAFRLCPDASASSPREIAWANHPQFGAGGPNNTPVFGWENFARGNTFLTGSEISAKGSGVAGHLPNYCVPYFDPGKGIAPSDCVGYQITPHLANLSCDPRLVQSAHKDAIPVGLGDGSVRGFSGAIINVNTWVRLCVPNDGQPILGHYRYDYDDDDDD
jgi:hypothetical protein